MELMQNSAEKGINQKSEVRDYKKHKKDYKKHKAVLVRE